MTPQRVEGFSADVALLPRITFHSNAVHAVVRRQQAVFNMTANETPTCMSSSLTEQDSLDVAVATRRWTIAELSLRTTCPRTISPARRIRIRPLLMPTT